MGNVYLLLLVVVLVVAILHNVKRVACQMTVLGNYSILSPVAHEAYSAKQVLPCTIRLSTRLSTSVPRFTVSLISLSSNIILVLADNANGKTPEWKQDATGTYYEYSIDYKIPETQPGSYTVVLLDPATQLQLSIPIVVSPKAHAFIATVASVNTVAADNTVASLTTVGTINATNTHGPKSSSLLGDNNAGAIISPGLATKTLFALAGVAGVAFML